MRSCSGSSGGDLLIVDPKTGDLLAVASQRHDGSLKVPAFTDPFEPGSTAKPFLLASLLSEGIISLTDSVDVMHGVYKKGRRVIRDVHPYDKLTVAEVVRYSSNVGAALLSERLTDDVQHKYLRDFGFGLSTGVDYPAESGGLLRKPERWSGLSAASLAMGYEISVTSLQLVMAYAALANGGRLLKPRLVKEVRKHSGEVLERRDPQTIRRVIEERVADQITDVLTSVVEGGNPSLVIFAKLENPQGAFYGGAVAAPISRSALQAALATRGVELTSGQVVSPADRFDWTQRQAEPDADLRSRLQMLPVDQGAVRFASAGQMHFARTETTATRRLPDLRGLSIRSATARLHALGMQAKLKASGRVEDQSPPPGSPALVGSVVLLR
jgi:cell division protein FtsI (penicillin-binding protein 3)